MSAQLSRKAFTLIELLTVIAIIAVLMGLLFPTIGAVKNAARKAMAKNDATQIVTAVKAYYTEYGKYPIDPGITAAGDVTYDDSAQTNDKLCDVLRNNTADSLTGQLNPRQIVFLEAKDARPTTPPTGGIGKTDNKFYDPWGNPYRVRIDGGYANQVANPYQDTDGSAGATNLRTGVIVWSIGADKKMGAAGNNLYKNSDDVISWQ